MLSTQERADIEAELEHHPNGRAASLEALKIVQKHRGWVSDEAIVDVAAVIGIPPAELDSVATFFNMIFRRPVGRNVILLCDSVSCWILGCDQIYAHLQQRLGIAYGQTTKDGRFTLLPNACLGTCDRAPAMMIGEDLHRDLTVASVDAALEGKR